MKLKSILLFSLFFNTCFAEVVKVYVVKDEDKKYALGIDLIVPKGKYKKSELKDITIQLIAKIDNASSASPSYVVGEPVFDELGVGSDAAEGIFEALTDISGVNDLENVEDLNIESPIWTHYPGFLVSTTPGSIITQGSQRYVVTNEKVQHWNGFNC